MAAAGTLCASLAEAAANAGAESVPPKVIVAVRADAPPRIDGLLDDPVWRGADPRDDFLQVYPQVGAAPSEPTRLRVAYDVENLYFAVFCADRQAASIERWLSRRDRTGLIDEVEISLDTYGDRRTALRFALSVAGVQRDGALYNDEEYDPEWDGVWEGRARVESDGWSAEIRIPLSQVPLRRSGEDGFGLQVRRRRRASNETDAWVYVPPWERGEVSRYGRIIGTDGIRPGTPLEILPFAVARRRAPAPGESLLGRSGLSGDAGVDLRYRPVPGFALNATLNPDFGQVELDQVVLNLTTFETFFPEKRPFFLEGSGFFTTPFTLFHSRRIGQAPPTVPLAAGETILHQPQESTILGAAKWTGKTRGGLTVGFLEAITETERAVIRQTDGSRDEAVAAPQTSSTILRLKQDLLRNSAVGVLGTLSDRTDGREAEAAGLDWSFRLHDNRYFAAGQLIRTRVEETGGAETGGGGQMSLGRQGGLHWRWDLSHLWLSPDADFNALGFMSRPDTRRSSASLAYAEERPGERLQSWGASLFGTAAHNRAGADFDRSLNLTLDLELRNFWFISTVASRQLEIFDDRETRGGPLFRIPALDSMSVSVFSDPRRRWGMDFGLDAGEEHEGSFWSANAGGSWRLGRRTNIGVSSAATRSTGSQRWVDTVEPLPGDLHFIFGDLDQRQVDLNLSGLVAVTPDLSIQGDVQIFAARVDYSSFRELTRPDRLETTPASLAFSSQPDFRSADLNAQMVVRWQYRPGSHLTLVLTRRQGVSEADASLDLRRTLADLGGRDGETVALIKLSYWWSP